MRELKIGMAVTYVDEDRQERVALVSCIHGNVFGGTVEHDGILIPGTEGKYWPCLNLVSASLNKGCQDQYGRQIERYSSVVHSAQSTAQGFCYRFLDEEARPELKQPPVS